MPLFIPNYAPAALYDGEMSLANSGTLTANTVYLSAMPPLQVGAVLNSIRVEIPSGGAGHYDVGIYDSSGANGVAGNLLAHAAATATTLATASGRQTPSLIGGNLYLSPGVYWLAFWIDNATDTVQRQSGNTQMSLSQIFSSTGPIGAVGTLADSGVRVQLMGLFLNGWS